MKEQKETKLSGVMGGCAIVFFLITVGLFFLMTLSEPGGMLIFPIVSFSFLITLLAGLLTLIIRYSEKNKE